MKNKISSLLFILFSTFMACGQKTFDEKMKSLYKNTVPLINAAELMPIQQNVILLDTRAQSEYAVSHLAGAKHIEYDKFSKRDVKDLPKDAEIVVYCSVGYRSERIGEKLQKMGFSNVKNLYGGIFDWKNKDLEIVNSKENPTDSVHTYNKNWGQWLYKGIKIN